MVWLRGAGCWRIGLTEMTTGLKQETGENRLGQRAEGMPEAEVKKKQDEEQKQKQVLTD